MRISSVDQISSPGSGLGLPLRLDQTPSRRNTVLLLLILLPAATALLAPYWLVAGGILTNAGLRQSIAGQPSSLLPVLFGVAFIMVLLGWPIKRLLDSLARSRVVEIVEGTIAVTDKGLFATRSWRAPLTAFEGVAHHVRASLSGVRHELILVHPRPRLSILLAMAPRMTQADVDRVTDMLDMPEIPPAAVYQFGPTRPSAQRPTERAVSGA
jgi:hypothetical protein